ncbi:MAG: hypothetical protein AAFR73_02735 [Pseudomonadota bacterium]
MRKSRGEAFLLTAILAVFAGCYGALSWLADGLYLDTHEGDTYHLLDILTRMDAGAVPHVDFLTPLGALSFWPIHGFMQTGFSAGQAMVLAQLAFAACLFLPLVYAANTRLARGPALYFGVIALGLVLALSYGTARSGVGISMHYNRWAWAVSFVMVLLAFASSRGPSRPLFDGLLIGVLGAALLLLKITYFVTLVPLAAMALLSMHGLRGLVFAVAGGAVVAGAVAAFQGFGFWLAYFADLRLVAGNDIRPYVGVSFDQIVAGPRFIAATLVVVAAALVIRTTRKGALGLAALLLVPAFLYITYQNFGNDPQWLLFIPVLLWALRPEAGAAELFKVDARHFANLTALAALVVFFPSLFNIALSPVKHMSFDQARFLPMLPEDQAHQDVFIRRDRAYMMTAQVYRDQQPGAWNAYEAEVARAPVPELGGVAFPYCEFMAGSRAMLETLGADLRAANLPAGSRLFTADLLAAYWFFAPVAPPEGSAPWYYGKLTGLRNADYVMVPKCAFTTYARNVILRELNASDYALTLVRDNELMALYRVGDQP